MAIVHYQTNDVNYVRSMKYKVTIERIKEVEGEKYPITNTVYEQTIEAVDEQTFVQGVVAEVNSLPTPL